MINEKTYEQTNQDLTVILASEKAQELFKNNSGFQEYLIRDWVLIREYEQSVPENNGYADVIFQQVTEILGTPDQTPDALASEHPVSEQDAATNHKLLKQTLYKHLSVTVNDLKGQVSGDHNTAVVQSDQLQPEQHGLENGEVPPPISTTTMVPAAKNGSIVKDFFKKPEVDVYSYTTSEQLKKLSLEDKFFHARKTQPWCKQAKKQLFNIYMWPYRAKSRAKVVKTKFIKNFNDTYGTHYQIMNLEQEFNRLYNRYIDGKSYKDAVRVWIIIVGIPFIVIVLGLSLGLTHKNTNG